MVQSLEDANMRHAVTDPSNGWYKNFLQRTGLVTASVAPLEISRQEWMTYVNYKRYYEVVAKILVDQGIARWNPAFKEDKVYVPRKKSGGVALAETDVDPECLMVLVDKPECMASYDETEVTLDQTTKRKVGIRNRL